MPQMWNLLLPIIAAVPLLSVLPLTIASGRKAHYISTLSSILVFGLVMLSAYGFYAYGPASFSVGYIKSFGITLGFQPSQIGTIMLIMTSIVFMAAAIASGAFVKSGEKRYNVIFAIAESASLVVFLTSSLFLFYVGWEVAEVMMFFIIFIYGSYGRKHAGIKFIVYSLASSLLLLVAILLLYLGTYPHTFSMPAIEAGAVQIPMNIQEAAIFLFVLSFMIKMPAFPFHSWLPEAHTEAPTTGSMILAGVLLKFGGYGLLLMFLLLPASAAYAKYIALLFGFSAVYSAFAALRQGNLKRAIAYTSITDMGIVGVGAAAVGILGSEGASYMMLSHGIVISLMFLIAGTFKEAYGTLDIDKIKGAMGAFPFLSYLFIFGSLALIGLPLTAGFVGDVILFIAADASFGLAGLVPLISLVFLGAMLFWFVERMLYSDRETNIAHGVDSRILAAAATLVFFSIAFGIIPALLLRIP